MINCTLRITIFSPYVITLTCPAHLRMRLHVYKSNDRRCMNVIDIHICISVSGWRFTVKSLQIVVNDILINIMFSKPVVIISNCCVHRTSNSATELKYPRRHVNYRHYIVYACFPITGYIIPAAHISSSTDVFDCFSTLTKRQSPSVVYSRACGVVLCPCQTCRLLGTNRVFRLFLLDQQDVFFLWGLFRSYLYFF